MEAEHAATSYGAHQEAASVFLSELLHHSPAPAGAQEVAQLVACRGAVIDALRDRLEHLGQAHRYAPGYWAPTTTAKAAERTLRLAAVATKPARALDLVADHLPRAVRGIEDNILSPVEALGSTSTDLTVERWRRAAVELTAGTHSLTTAASQPWLDDPGGAWHLIGDTATSLEAVVVLDAGLDKAGVLAGHDRAAKPGPSKFVVGSWSVAEQRMVTSQVARAAGWYASTTAPDLAKPASTSRPSARGPIRVVAALGDVASAQRELTNYIRAPNESDSFSSALRSMDAVTVGVVVRGQASLCTSMRDRCRTLSADLGESTVAGELDLAGTFERYRVAYTELQGHVEKLVDVEARGVNRAAVWQQQEITAGLARLHGQPQGASKGASQGVSQGVSQLSVAEALELASATHGLLRELATATRRELMRDAGTLRGADPLGVQAPFRIGRNSTTYNVLTAAVAAPPPVLPVTHWAPLTSRRDLADMLNRTPVGNRPSPFLRGHRSHGRRSGPASGGEPVER